MVSIVLSVLRSGMPERDVIFATDVRACFSIHPPASIFIFNDSCFPDTAMPLLQKNICANSHYYRSVTPQGLVLDWNNETLPLEVCELGGLDIIV